MRKFLGISSRIQSILARRRRFFFEKVWPPTIFFRGQISLGGHDPLDPPGYGPGRGLGAQPPAGSRAGAPGLRGRSPRNFFEILRCADAFLAIQNPKICVTEALIYGTKSG